MKAFNYSSEGYYYITICSKSPKYPFGTIINDFMDLSLIGQIAKQCWRDIPKHHKHIKLDEYVIMPNHVHGIIQIHRCVGARHASHLRNKGHMYNKLSMVIGSFKSAVTRNVKNKYPEKNFVWYKSFYDHVIRNEKDYARIWEYIVYNPHRWADDKYNKT